MSRVNVDHNNPHSTRSLSHCAPHYRTICRHSVNWLCLCLPQSRLTCTSLVPPNISRRFSGVALCLLLVGGCVSVCHCQLGTEMSASVYSDASCQTWYPGFDLSSVSTNGCVQYSPAVNPYQLGAVGASAP